MRSSGGREGTPAPVVDLVNSSGSSTVESLSASRRGKMRASNVRQKRKLALNAMKERRVSVSRGLGILESSSDSESDDESEGEDEGDTAAHKARRKQKKANKYDTMGFSMEKNAKREFLMKFTREGRERRSRSPQYESDGIDDFIVADEDDDEEDDDEAERRGRSSGDEDEEAGADALRRKRIAVSDDEDEAVQDRAGTQSDNGSSDEDEFAPEIDVKKSAKTSTEKKKKKQKKKQKSEKEKKRRVVRDSDDEGVEGSDEEEEEDAASGPMLYWQVDAMLDQKKEELSRQRGHAKRHHTRQEAMHLYLEMLARAHLDPDFSMDNADEYKFASGAKQIEDLICTTRESLLASGAWNTEFAKHIQSRPFFTVAHREEDPDCVKCAACNRRSKWLPGSPVPLRIAAYMYGTKYDARTVWTSGNWAEHMPPEVFMWSDDKKKKDKDDGGDEDEDDSDDDDDDDDDDEKEDDLDTSEKWWLRKWPQRLMAGKDKKFLLGCACAGRSQMYHNLLHYKFRLLLRVRSKLETVKGDVDALMKDPRFVKAEVQRFNRMLDLAGSRFGGREQALGISGTDIWNDAAEQEDVTEGLPTAQMVSTPGGGGSGGSGSGSGDRGVSKKKVMMSTPTMTAWLTRQ